ncbi:hypothetical protein EDD18DRAFT_1107631 [Armillaria luteobubalina]|uniref:Uncharacterized protein n=1 Tax=Armillaria luteobubalina TaxID=153913 RepID=A0AA39Q2D9_9AGAR|nr:hypothetical protein EDD18DRAFT_1107631 [Armillaria luteobubalina]
MIMVSFTVENEVDEHVGKYPSLKHTHPADDHMQNKGSSPPREPRVVVAAEIQSHVQPSTDKLRRPCQYRTIAIHGDLLVGGTSKRGAKEDRQAPGELIQVPKPAVQKWAAYSIEEWLPNGCKASLKEISFTWRSKLWQTKGTMANPWSPQLTKGWCRMSDTILCNAALAHSMTTEWVPTRPGTTLAANEGLVDLKKNRRRSGTSAVAEDCVRIRLVPWHYALRVTRTVEDFETAIQWYLKRVRGRRKTVRVSIGFGCGRSNFPPNTNPILWSVDTPSATQSTSLLLNWDVDIGIRTRHPEEMLSDHKQREE